MNDLFNTPEMWPDNLKALIDDFNESKQDYQDLRNLLDLSRRIGFTFDFGLDCVPYNLEKIENPLFSIHSISQLENRTFSVFHANIPNTTENLAYFNELFCLENWYFEFHFTPISLKFTFGT
jgi:hypothetical protein